MRDRHSKEEKILLLQQEPGWHEIIRPDIEEKIKSYKSSIIRMDPEKDKIEMARTQGKVIALESLLNIVDFK